MITLKFNFRFMKSKSNIETSMDSPEDSIVRMRAELKELIHDEEVIARNAQKKRLNALKARHAAISAETFASRFGNISWPLGIFNKLVQRNLRIKKNLAAQAEALSREADEVLKRIRESKEPLIIRLAQASGFEPPHISEKDIEEQTAKEKLLYQSLSKELEEAEAALKEAVLEKEQKELEFQNLKESIRNKAKAEVTEKEQEHLKKAKAECLNAVEKEKRLAGVVQKKKVIAERAALDYEIAIKEIIRRKEADLLKPILHEPPAQGLGKVVLLVNSVFEIMKGRFVEKEITDIPIYDSSKYGEIVSFVLPENSEVVEQTWISKPYTLVTILYNKQTRKNMYYVSEPVLNSFEEALLQRVDDSLKVILLEQEIDFSHMNKEIVLYNNFIKTLNIYGVYLDPKSLQKIWYHIKRNYVGYGKLDVLLKDPMIEDIACVGADTPIYLYHRKYTNIETNIIFEEEELNQTIMKLAQISGKSISTGYPIMNARLPDGSRLEATLGREVTTRGGTITIRKFREEPFTPTDLIKYGTFNIEIMAYLWLAVENNKSMIFVGETASGKTTTLNVVSLFIPSESKIISIEDTREITLFHKNWIPGVVREAFMGQEAAAIDMFELLRSALRQRPEYLIVGEVRGKEAYTLFQAMSTGHTTYSTMHAGSVQLAVNRLLNEPINVPLMMLSALNIMIVQVLRYVGRKRVRRMELLSEFVGIDPATGNISIRELYKWNPVHDRMEESGPSKVLEDIMNSRGWSREQLKKELDNRRAVLQYMVDKDISDYRDVSLIIRMYASDPEKVISTIIEGRPLSLEVR